MAQRPSQRLDQLMQALLEQPELTRKLRDRVLAQARCFSWRQTGEATLSILKQNR